MRAAVLEFAFRSAADLADADVTLLGPRLRRGLSTHQRLVVDAFSAVTRGVDRAALPIVHGSELGELETAVALATSEDPSPARFSVSVHSSVIGQIAIAAGNRRGHVTLSAGADTLAMVLVEALGALEAGEPEVVVVVADESSPSVREPGDAPFALAMRLAPERDGRPVLELVGCNATSDVRLADRSARLADALASSASLVLPPSRLGFPAVQLRSELAR